MKKEFPKKWAYKLEEDTKEHFKEILDLARIKHFWNLDSPGCYYMVSGKDPVSCPSSVKEGYTPVTLQELQDHYLPKLSEMKEKKILGYKAPFDLFGGKIKKGTIYPATETEDYTHPYFVPIEIVKTWEPVYAPEYKVGDFVFAVNDGGNGIEGEGEQLVEIADNLFSEKATGLLERGDNWDYVVKQGNDFYRVDSTSAKFRKASETEIKEWKAKQLPKIAGYKAEIALDTVNFGCVTLKKEDLKSYRYLMNSSANAKITVHDTDITAEMINKLLKALEQ